MTAFVEDRVSAQHEQTRYKQKLIETINQLQKTVIEAPAELDMPKNNVSGILQAAAELINAGDRPAVEAEQRMRIELDDALVPLGYVVNLCPLA